MRTNVTEEEVNSLNPLFVFLALFIVPYLLFIALLMLMTGETDVNFLIESIMKDNNAVLAKTWVIGSFILSIIGTVVISGVGAKRYIDDQSTSDRKRGVRPKPGQTAYLFEDEQGSNTQLPVASELLSETREKKAYADEITREYLESQLSKEVGSSQFTITQTPEADPDGADTPSTPPA